MEYPFPAANLQNNTSTNNINVENSLRYGFGYKPKDKNCKDIGYKTCNDYSIMFGSNKPLKENKEGPTITGNLTYDPNTSCNNLWNNSTKRKIIVDNFKN